MVNTRENLVALKLLSGPQIHCVTFANISRSSLETSQNSIPFVTTVIDTNSDQSKMDQTKDVFRKVVIDSLLLLGGE